MFLRERSLDTLRESGRMRSSGLQNSLLQIGNGTFHLAHAHATRRMCNLPVKIGDLDSISIYQA